VDSSDKNSGGDDEKSFTEACARRFALLGLRECRSARHWTDSLGHDGRRGELWRFAGPGADQVRDLLGVVSGATVSIAKAMDSKPGF